MLAVEMGRFLVVATAGAGGDLQPLLGAVLALRERGHETILVGDRSVARSLAPLGLEARELPESLDLGPIMSGAIRDAMARSGGDLAAAGPLVERSMSDWADQVAEPVADFVRHEHPDAIVTSLFGVEVLKNVAPACPWAIVNSTFYVGPNPPRPMERDFGPRAIPLIGRYASLLGSASLVLHATDRLFDLDFDGLPSHHHYVGPLGIWEPPSDPPPYLDEPGDPWVLVTISSQLQDDLPIAEVALAALAGRPVRALLTLGPDHEPGELEAIPSNAVVAQTISHSAVLERGALLVSHAGHGSVMKALWHGRPMVLVPWGRDQPGVAARAAALGVAEVVPRENASEETLSAAIDRVLNDADMKEAAGRNGSRLRATDPPGTAADLLESML
jgi:UDP:flavonoid glycosyltransferase YjiC (YdhE family)